ncbi:MAG: hypothetical protein K1000chlam2_00612 [Chlamydiae bacterium]|nr:hypothetical protein [Chlamydiota bacterium]
MMQAISDSSSSIYILGGITTILALGVAHQVLLNCEIQKLSNQTSDSILKKVDAIKRYFFLSSAAVFELDLKALAACIDLKSTDRGFDCASKMEGNMSNAQVANESKALFCFYQSILHRQRKMRNSFFS